MKILVTGADGFLGKTVLDALKSAGKNVVAVSRRNTTAGAIFCDLSDPSSVLKVLRDERPSCIVNIAAQPNFSAALEDLYSVNTLAPAIIADFCKKNDVYMIQISSSSVHGFHHIRFNADTPYEPDFDYGISKLLADKAVIASGCKSAIIRFGGIFGANGPTHLGINRSIALARQGIPPKVFGNGTALRNYTYVKDATAMIMRCLNDELQGIFYAGGETISIRKMLESICNQFLGGVPPETSEGSDPPDQLLDVSPDLGQYRTFSDALADIERDNRET
jgi:nucleoside-diphosphate-sugar epimerase